MARQGKNIIRLSKSIEEIPTLPVISREVLELLDDPETNFIRLSGVIEQDQALAVKVLKVANSSFYGTLNRVSSIEHALAVLGLAELKAILLAFSIHNFFDSERSPAFDRTRFWKHSIICSQIAKYLEQYFHLQSDGSIFLSGLVHDMGKVVLDQFFHDEFLTIIDLIAAKGESFSAAEKEVIGATHYQIAAKVLQQWNFPHKVIFQVFYHHAPWYDRNYLSGSIIIFLANYFTKCLGYTCHEHEKQVDITHFVRSGAMDYVVKNGFDLDEKTIDHMLLQIKEYIDAEQGNMLRLFEQG